VVRIACRTGICLLVICAMTGSLPSAAEPSPEHAPDVISGTLEVVTDDDFETGRSRYFYYVHDEVGERHQLRFTGRPEPELPSGARVVARGTMKDGILSVGSGDAGAFVVSEVTFGGSTSGLAEVNAMNGERRTLVMIVDSLDDTVSCSDSEIEAMMFTGANSVDGLYQESSFGALSFPHDTDGDASPDVVRLSIDVMMAGTCDRYGWAAAAETEAENAGIDLTLYQHRIFVLPMAGTCGWAGAANVGCPSYCRTWIRYCTFPDVWAHELGHNLGMRHASTDPGDDGTIDCDYCDTSDFMGYAGYGWRQVNGPHKYEMEWLAPEQITEISPAAPQTHALSPLELDAMSAIYPQLIRIATGAGDYYYLSYRRRIGYDQGISASYYDKINIHRSAADGTGPSSLVVTLGDGEVFDGVDGLSVTQVSHDDTSVTVVIEDSNPACTDGDSDGICDADDLCPNDPANDGDSDGVCGDVDCDGANPDVHAVPSVVTDLTAEMISALYRFDWKDQSATAGSGTVYDVYSGYIADLRWSGDYSLGSCAGEDVTAPSFDASDPYPSTSECLYYLVRAQNGCPSGTGSYGDSERDGLADSGPGACN
jgi:hypothetical protein